MATIKNLTRWALVPSVFFVDRFFKIWVSLRLKEGEGFPVLKGVFHVTRVNNTGAAFGLWKNASYFLIGVTVLSALAIFYYLFGPPGTGKERSKNFYGWSFVLGGALGNLYDRVRFGFVVDFLDFRVWPVFNVADASICLGVFYVFWSVFYASDSV